MEIDILYQDADFFAIDKPAGIVVNNAASVTVPTIQDWARDHVAAFSRVDAPYDAETDGQADQQSAFYQRSGVVHRLDKETSGVLLIAKSQKAFAALQAQFSARRVVKVYTALVHGKLTPEQATVQAPVGRLKHNRRRFGISVGGRPARTQYRAIQHYEHAGEQFSLVSFFPTSGRTHQIRVHAQYMHHPIVADPLYLGKKQYARDRRWCSRLFLHAAQLTVEHPTSKKSITIQSNLPDDLHTALAKCTRLRK